MCNEYSGRKRCRFTRRAWQVFISPSQKAGIVVAGNGHTQVGKQAGESKLGLKVITGSHK